MKIQLVIDDTIPEDAAHYEHAQRIWYDEARSSEHLLSSLAWISVKDVVFVKSVAALMKVQRYWLP